MRGKKYVSLLFLLILLFTGCGKKTYTEDELKFKEEYESLNNFLKSDGKTKHKEMNISKDNNVKYINADEVIKMLESGTGIIYFGFPECPWCRNSVPVLLEAARENDMDIYYFNALSIRDTKKLEDGNIVTTKEGTDEYYKIVELLGDFADTYSGLDDESIKRLYFPTVVAVSDGVVVGTHTGTVESQKDSSIDLSDKQRNELLDIYTDLILKVSNSYCDEKC